MHLMFIRSVNFFVSLCLEGPSSSNSGGGEDHQNRLLSSATGEVLFSMQGEFLHLYLLFEI